MQYTRGGQHDHRDRPVDRRFYTELTTYLERTFFNQYFRKYMKLKKLHFTIFRTYAFVTDWSIASYQEIFQSFPVEDKLAALQYTDFAYDRKKTHYRRLWHHRRTVWHRIYDAEEGIKQGSATFPETRAKNKLCKVWRAVLNFHQQFRSFAVVKSWEFMEF